MDIQTLENAAQKFMLGLPDQIIEALEDVELMVAENPDLARKVLVKEFSEGDFDPSELPDDCKGVFVGAPTEIESEDTTDSEENEVVYFPDGFIVLCASNIADEKDGLLVLMHEVGHALGMDEDEVKALGLGVAPESMSKVEGKEGDGDVSTSGSE